MSIGINIAAARDAAGITQAELAAAIGVTSQAVSNWELDKDIPKTENLLPLARRLGVTVDWILAGEASAWPLWKRLRPKVRPLAIRMWKSLLDESNDLN